MNTVSLPAWIYIPLALLFGAGFILLLLALFMDRSRGRKRCPRCWYDMSGASSLRCSECGHVSRDEQSLYRTRRRPALAVLGVVCLVPVLGFFMYRDGKRLWYALPPKWSNTQTVRANGVVAKAFTLRNPDERGGKATVTYDGKTIVEFEDYMASLGITMWDPATQKELPPIGAGQDLNGDGVLDLLLTSFSGGNGCCYVITLVEMSQPPRVVARIDTQNGMGAQQLDSGEVILALQDLSFDGWRAPRAASPRPGIWYRLRGHRLEVALAEMLPAQPPLDAKTLAERAEYIRTITTTDPGALNADLWSPMLELLYAGYEAECWKFFDDCWPDSAPGKAEFKPDFMKTLESGPRWKDFAAALAAHRAGAPLPAPVFEQTEDSRTNPR